MTSRREVLQVGLAGAMLLPLATLGGLWRASAAPAPIYKVIFDERFPASVALARELNVRGIRMHGIRGDVTALWYHDLYFQWRAGPAHVVGVTTNEALFCLDTLARDAGHRVTHRRSLDEGLVSWSIGPRISPVFCILNSAF